MKFSSLIALSVSSLLLFASSSPLQAATSFSLGSTVTSEGIYWTPVKAIIEPSLIFSCQLPSSNNSEESAAVIPFSEEDFTGVQATKGLWNYLLVVYEDPDFVGDAQSFIDALRQDNEDCPEGLETTITVSSSNLAGISCTIDCCSFSYEYTITRVTDSRGETSTEATTLNSYNRIRWFVTDSGALLGLAAVTDDEAVLASIYPRTSNSWSPSQEDKQEFEQILESVITQIQE